MVLVVVVGLGEVVAKVMEEMKLFLLNSFDLVPSALILPSHSGPVV